MFGEKQDKMLGSNANNRMLIITSDENLIEEVSVRQSCSTQMIDLNGKQMNNSMDLQFLAQFSQFVTINFFVLNIRFEIELV